MKIRRLGLNEIISLVSIISFVVPLVPFIASLLKDPGALSSPDENEEDLENQATKTDTKIKKPNEARELLDDTIGKLEKRKEETEDAGDKAKLDNCITKLKNLEGGK